MNSKGVLKRKGASLATQEAKTSFVKAHRLNPCEENALRMLHGLGVDTQEALPKACAGNEDIADELLLVEMQLFRAARLRQSTAHLQQSTVGLARPSPQKSKIISALRTKK